ncbi:hypothetical protein E8E13_004983 [Curvularia kusanoi]|uniref:Uncharacterized protein n=1 Tax=Curvularia kusanoi TaxID=90978 RepID=A0A9P4W3W4_CURKU|nr:hypothetical protein E8E13_004983 [Curvularia kusanoi]
MSDVMAQHGATLVAPASRQDVVSELLDDYTYEESYEAEDMSPKSGLAPAFDELSQPPPRSESLRDPKAEAIQRMNTKFQLREDDNSSVSSYGSRNGSLEHTPRARITSRSLSRSGTPPSLKLFVSNGATAHIPPTPVVYPPVKSLPSSITPNSEEVPPPPPERSVRRKELSAAGMGHRPSKSELERNDSFHSQKDGVSAHSGPSEDVVAAPIVQRKAVPEAGVKKFVSLFELNNGPRGGKQMPAPTSAPRGMGAKNIGSSATTAASKIPVRTEGSNNQLPPTPPEEKSTPVTPRKALVSNKQPASPLHARGKSNTGFNILKAQRPAPPIPTMKKEVTTPEMTPSPTLKPEIRMDNEISPMRPLPPPTEQHRPFSYEGPGDAEQGSPQQKKSAQHAPTQQETPASLSTEEETVQSLTASNPPLRTTSLDPPEPSPSVRPMTAPAPQSTFSTTHPSLSTQTLPSTLPSSTDNAQEEDPFLPLTEQSIPLPLNLIPRITASQLHCYTNHATSVWSNNVFQPMGCMVCHSNEKDRKFSCTWCQLRICRACSEELVMVPRRDLGALLQARQSGEKGMDMGFAPRVLVEDVDGKEEEEERVEFESEEVEGRGGRGRSMMKVDSRERNEVVTPRE